MIYRKNAPKYIKKGGRGQEFWSSDNTVKESYRSSIF